MSGLAIAFMAASWSFVLGLTGWCFVRVLRADRRRKMGDTDGTTGGDA